MMLITHGISFIATQIHHMFHLHKSWRTSLSYTFPQEKGSRRKNCEKGTHCTFSHLILVAKMSTSLEQSLSLNTLIALHHSSVVQFVGFISLIKDYHALHLMINLMHSIT